MVEHLNMTLLQIYHWVYQWKNIENQSIFGEVTCKSVVSCFLLTHSAVCTIVLHVTSVLLFQMTCHSPYIYMTSWLKPRNVQGCLCHETMHYSCMPYWFMSNTRMQFYNLISYCAGYRCWGVYTTLFYHGFMDFSHLTYTEWGYLWLRPNGLDQLM